MAAYLGLDPMFICSSLFTAQQRKRLYWLLKYKLPLFISDVWIAGKWLDTKDYPEYFKDGKYVKYQTFDLMPFKKLPDGNIAVYRVLSIGSYGGGSDFCGWDDNRKYDLVFHSVIAPPVISNKNK